MAKPRPEPNLRSQWLGEKMRDLRKSRGISQSDAADYMQRDATMLGRYESGLFPFRRVDVMGLLTLYGVEDDRTRNGLLQICDEAWQRNWWDDHQSDLGEDFINVPWLESRAERICIYQHYLVHGLFQTRDYADAVITRLEGGHASADQIDRWVALRLERQQILTADRQPKIDAIFESAVIERIIGSAEVMRSQLRRLLALGDHEAVTIRVVPAETGPHAGLDGSFNFFEMPEPYPAVANIETAAGMLYVEEPKVSKFRSVWEDLDRSALDAELSAELITKRLKEIK
ncbi:helix-turn-helix domain-containing protein [Glycomyces dulcitolivorans]|uniref:helix-turn-helix domain-containing protein n=1 Tax=Glycomyces dulcitolivorans TaxID=2200759 RepID=UPI001300660F|nr:helix-turn-helix transcriptional regulator [Glycomyces dulcitolivorans]